MKLSPQTRQDIKDLAGFLFGVASLLVLISGILFGPDVLSAIVADHRSLKKALARFGPRDADRA